MSTKENGLEIKVGLFICIGFAVIAAMIVRFGLGGSEGFKKYYPLQVDLPSANGLLKGSDVLLAGARVGFVSSKPLLAGDLGTVRVTVSIEEKYRIPKNSAFKVDSSGLLGDKFVSIQTPSDFNPSQFDPNNPQQAYQRGDTIRGVHIPDFTEEAGPTLEKLSKELDEIQKATTKLNNGLLSDANLLTVHQTLVSMKTTSDNFAEASKGFGSVVLNAQDTVDKARQTMTPANVAADDLRKVLESARGLMEKATHGDGLLAALLSNRELTENFKALVINLRQHGVLFYRDSGKGNAQPQPSPEAAAPGKKKR